jgi:hypothetical protein
MPHERLLSTALGRLAAALAARPVGSAEGVMRTAREAVKERYPDAVCVRTMFGLAILAVSVAGEEQQVRRLGEVRGAAWPEEAWVAAAASLERAEAEAAAAEAADTADTADTAEEKRV